MIAHAFSRFASMRGEAWETLEPNFCAIIAVDDSSEDDVMTFQTPLLRHAARKRCLHRVLSSLLILWKPGPLTPEVVPDSSLESDMVQEGHDSPKWNLR